MSGKVTSPSKSQVGELVERLEAFAARPYVSAAERADLAAQAAALRSQEERISELKAEVERVKGERDALRPVFDAALGLSFGEDWNHGNAAKKHGYRRKLIEAVGHACRAFGVMPSPRAERAEAAISGGGKAQPSEGAP